MTKIAQAEQQALDTITYPTAFPEIVALSEAQGVMLVPFLAHNASTLSSTIPSSQFGLPPVLYRNTWNRNRYIFKFIETKQPVSYQSFNTFQVYIQNKG